jgi:hypothetical protein
VQNHGNVRAAPFLAETAETYPDLDSDAAVRLVASEPMWRECAWLAELAATSVAGDFPWPRVMSPPHPRAVGSLGGEACDWIERHSVTKRLRPWQRLVIYRVLEVDAAGELCWLNVLLSTPRQVGKSVVVCALAFWRMHQHERFGETQLVMQTGKDLAVCREVMRPARIHAKRLEPFYSVREANGQEEIGNRHGNRWMVRARYSVYGYSASLGIVDEAWGVSPEVVEDGIEPTMGDRIQPQLMLVSTAHRRASSVMPLRRQTAIERLFAESTDLLIEWSAPRGTDISDRAAWRACSPHWATARERLLESKLERTVAGVSDDPDEDDPIESFRAQWLNIWPGRRLLSASRDEPLVQWETWRDAVDVSVSVPVAGNVVAVEDFYGTGAAACAAGRDPSGRVVVWGDCFASRGEAWAWAAYLIGERPDTRLVVGASLSGDPAVAACNAVGVEMAGSTKTRAALPLIRELLAGGAIAHSGGSALNAQVQNLRVLTHREGGLGISPRSGRNDLARAMGWAVLSLVNVPAPQPFYVY